MDDYSLRLFLNLSRTLRFLRTSRECHVSPSALSRAIQRLEAEVGYSLFERDRRTVRLTPEGERLANEGRDLLERWDRLRTRLKASGEVLAGTISLFASVTACQSFLPELLSGFRERYPEVHLRLDTGYAAEAMEMLHQDKVDVVVAALPVKIPSALVAKPFIHTPMVLVAPTSPCEVERLCRPHSISLAEIPMVLPSSGLVRVNADQWFRRKRITPRIYAEVQGHEAILALVSLGCGVGIVPRIVVEKSPLRANVRVLPVDPEIGEFRVGFCIQRHKLKSPLISAFWDAVSRTKNNV